MHSSLILLTILLAVAWRWQGQGLQARSMDRSWQGRWEAALNHFCLPPLMILLVAGAVLSMGHHGTMMGRSVSPVGCWASQGVLLFGSSVLVYSLGQAVAINLRLRQYATITLPQGDQARCVPIDVPMAAQTGLWHSSLLVSQGWLDQLTAHEQQAILAHEQAHASYHDSFWFLGLGMLRRFAFWLPSTNALWEELLLLREMRADQQAAQTSDPLLLAELLVRLSRQRVLGMPSSALGTDIEPCVGFNESLSLSRLEQRVNALTEPDSMPKARPSVLGRLAWLLTATLPMVATWLHT
jgi:Zn-dependent protease with chaperone function